MVLGGRRGGVAALVLASLVVLSAAGVASAAPPDVSVSVNGTDLPDGGSVTVTESPDVTIDASADSEIGSVSVRVDGDVRKRFSPGTKSFSKTVSLDLEDGDHELTVVVSASETVTHSGTVTKDSTGPRVAYTSPFTTSRLGVPDDVETVDRGNVTLAGDLYDTSGVERIVIERVYRWKFAGDTQVDKTTYRINDPGDSFSKPILLGPGDNQMTVTLTDVHGHKQIHKWTIRVEDRTAPAIRIDSVERLSDGSEVRVNGTVTDGTKVRSLSYTFEGSASEKQVLSRTDEDPTRKRLSTEFSFTATAGEGVDTLTLIAEDTAGNTRTKDVSLNFEQRVKPTISLDRKATTVDGDRVRVVGTVADGRVTRVTVETVSESGDVIALETIHDGEAVKEVAIDTSLAGVGEGTTVIVRAVDTMGREHRESISVTESTGGTGATTTAAEATTAADTTVASGGGGGGSDGGDGSARNRADAGGGTSFPLVGPVALVVGAVALAAIGLVARRVVTGDEGPPADAPSTSEGTTDAGAESTTEAGTGGAAAGAASAGAAASSPSGGGPRACPSCGAAIPESAMRCGECGGLIKPGSDRPTGEGATPDDRSPADAATDPAAGAAEDRGAPAADERPTADDATASDTGAAAESADDAETGTADDGSSTDHAGAAPEGTTGDAAGAAGTASDADPLPDSPPDFLDASSLSEIGEADVEALVERLDDDDPETVAAAAGTLGRLAAERPELGLAGEERLRELRLDPNLPVSEAASAAVERYEER